MSNKSSASGCSSTMESITDISFGPLPADSPYVKPFRMYYTQNGVAKNWDLLKVHDSVTIIIFNRSTQRLVFVKQFRPAVYYGLLADANGRIEQPIDVARYPASLGVTVELCAGIVDKTKPFVEIAREEVLEECGYDVPVDAIEEIMTYRSGVGASGALQKLYYCEVTDEMRTAQGGGGVDDELIECVDVSVEEARRLVSKGANNPSPPSFLLGVLWFLANRAPGVARSNL